MNLQEMGVVLRTEREKRGLAIDDVADRLKINARLLRALEEGDEESLPHAVYVRGFVRSYANHLGLDPEDFQSAVEQLESDELDATPVSVYSPQQHEGKTGGGRIFFLVFLVLCLIGLAVAWIYRDADLFSELQQARLTTAQPAPPLNPAPVVENTKKQKSERAGKKQTPVPSANATAPATVVAAETPPAQAQTPAQAGTQTTAQKAGQPAAQAQAPAVAQQEIPPTAPAPGQAAQPTAQQAVSAAAATPVNGQHKIIITALSECWIHSNADNADTRQFSLRKGDTFALTFSHKLTLKLGNAGGVRIRYNGQDIPALGKDGQVKTLTFPPTE